MTHRRSNVVVFVLDNSLLLLLGTAAAALWANLDLTTYEAVADPLHVWVNEMGMVFFFALAGKEVFEATRPGGTLASPRQALSPLAAAVGGGPPGTTAGHVESIRTLVFFSANRSASSCFRPLRVSWERSSQTSCVWVIC